MILEREKFRRLVWDGERFLSFRGCLGASEGEAREGEAGGVGPGLRRRSGIESDELAAMEPPWTEMGDVGLEEPGRPVGVALPFLSVMVLRELGVGGKLRENGEGSSPGCRGMEDVDIGRSAGTCLCGS